MTKFYYTHDRPVFGSTAVDRIAYNENSRELLVALKDNTYVYPGVTLNAFKAFAVAHSKGTAYQGIKENYGPSQYLGRTGAVELVEGNGPVVLTSAPAAPHWERPRGPGGRFLSAREVENSNVATSISATDIVSGTLTSVGGNSTGPRARYDLSGHGAGRVTNVPSTSARRTEVVFSVEGVGEEKTYAVDVDSEAAALTALEEAVAALGLTVKVVRVVIHY